MADNSFDGAERQSPQYGDRSNNIDLLRFIAASLVLYSHMGALLGKSGYTIMGQDLGYIAVNVFFLLSGYLIACSWTHSTGFVSYLIRRVARIFPALVVVTLATVLLVGPLFTALSMVDYFTNPQTWGYLKVILLASPRGLPGVFENLPYPLAVNGSLWTLRYEFAMYLLVPLAYFLLHRLGGARKSVAFCLLALLVLGYCLTSYFAAEVPEICRHGIRLATYFFAGSVVYEFDIASYIDIQYSALALLFMLVFAREGGLPCILLMFVATTVFVFGFALAPQPRFAKCFSKNDFSYGLYIWAFPVQQALVQLGGGSAQSSTLLYSIGAFAITIVLAMGSWFLVEKPCMVLGRQLSKRF